MSSLDGERWWLALYAAFVGFFLAFGSTAIIGAMTQYDPAPQELWFFITAPVFSVGGFLITWGVTRP